MLTHEDIKFLPLCTGTVSLSLSLSLSIPLTCLLVGICRAPSPAIKQPFTCENGFAVARVAHSLKTCVVLVGLGPSSSP